MPPQRPSCTALCLLSLVAGDDAGAVFSAVYKALLQGAVRGRPAVAAQCWQVLALLVAAAAAVDTLEVEEYEEVVAAAEVWWRARVMWCAFGGLCP